MKIQVVNLRKNNDTNNVLAGVATIMLNDSIIVEDIKIINMKDKLFVAMPSRKISTGEYADWVFPTKVELRNEITEIILNYFNNGGSSVSGALEEMHVTSVKIQKINDTTTDLKAVATIELNNVLVINDIKIVEIAPYIYEIYMPYKMIQDNSKTVVYSKNFKLTEEIKEKVLNQYKKLI